MGCRKCLAPPGNECAWAGGPRDLAITFHEIRDRDAAAARALLVPDCVSLLAPKSLLDWGPDGLYDDTRAVHLHGHCHAASDGECAWRQCPQLQSYKGHCPLDKETSDE